MYTWRQINKSSSQFLRLYNSRFDLSLSPRLETKCTNFIKHEMKKSSSVLQSFMIHLCLNIFNFTFKESSAKEKGIYQHPNFAARLLRNLMKLICLGSSIQNSFSCATLQRRIKLRKIITFESFLLQNALRLCCFVGKWKGWLRDEY